MTVSEVREIVEGSTSVARLIVRTELLQDLACAAIAASKDSGIPYLMSVQLSWDGTVLSAIATDRYRAAVIESATGAWSDEFPVQSGEPFTVLVNAKEFMAAVKALPKPVRNSRVNLAFVTVTDEYVTITSFDESVSRRLDRVAGDFPRVRSLIPTEFVGLSGDEQIAFSPTFLADVAKMPIPRSTPVRFRFNSPTRPAVATGGDSDGVSTWLYLLMPVRLSG